MLGSYVITVTLLAAASQAATALPTALSHTSIEVLAGPQPAPPPHYWPHARGHVGSYGTTPSAGPVDLNASFAWSFHHPAGRYHTVMLGGAVIDREKNIYVATTLGIFKLSPTGDVRWHYNQHGDMSTVPSLMGDVLYGSTIVGWYFALNLTTGEELWARNHTHMVGGDTSYVEAHAGVVVAGSQGQQGGGNKATIGIDASNGDKLWEYTLDNQRVWNVMPMFPDDDTTVFMDLSGGVYRLGLHNGSVIWAHPGRLSFSDGGLVLGPDGDIYTCSNPLWRIGLEGTGGVLRKFALADGRKMWESPLPYPCNSWPAVSNDGSTVVVVPGSFNDNPPTLRALQLGLVDAEDAEEFHRMIMNQGLAQRSKIGLPDLRAAIMTFDTTTGAELLRHDVVPWGEVASAGDEEGLMVRMKYHSNRVICLPAHWSSPTIDSSGAVYVGRTDGRLYRFTSTGEASYVTGAGPLHSGATFAPGMMAYTDCDSLYMFHM